MNRDFQGQRFFKQCPTCKGSGKEYTNSYCDTINGIYKRTCHSCFGTKLIEISLDEIITESRVDHINNLEIALELFKEEIKCRGLINE